MALDRGQAADTRAARKWLRRKNDKIPIIIPDPEMATDPVRSAQVSRTILRARFSSAPPCDKPLFFLELSLPHSAFFHASQAQTRREAIGAILTKAKRTRAERMTQQACDRPVTPLELKSPFPAEQWRPGPHSSELEASMREWRVQRDAERRHQSAELAVARESSDRVGTGVFASSSGQQPLQYASSAEQAPHPPFQVLQPSARATNSPVFPRRGALDTPAQRLAVARAILRDRQVAAGATPVDPIDRILASVLSGGSTPSTPSRAPSYQEELYVPPLQQTWPQQAEEYLLYQQQLRAAYSSRSRGSPLLSIEPSPPRQLGEELAYHQQPLASLQQWETSWSPRPSTPSTGADRGGSYSPCQEFVAARSL